MQIVFEKSEMMSVRDKILDIAEQLFNQNGYAATGVDLIRDNAGVSKTSMYRHFGSKNKLIEAVLIRRDQRFKQQFEEQLQSVNGAENKLIALLDWHFDWFAKKNFNGCMFVKAAEDFKFSDETISAIAITHKQWLKQLILDILSIEKEKPILKAECLFTLFEGIIARAVVEDIQPQQEVFYSVIKSLITI